MSDLSETVHINK